MTAFEDVDHSKKATGLSRSATREGTVILIAWGKLKVDTV
jgi:hypothetical protein